MIFEGSAMQKHERHTGLIVVLSMAAVIAAIAGICSRFGGFGTVDCAGTEDFSGCEAINRYIHDADGTAAEVLSAIGFESIVPEKWRI